MPVTEMLRHIVDSDEEQRPGCLNLGASCEFKSRVEASLGGRQV